MTNHDHERAIDLITRHGIEEVAAGDSEWLQSHLAMCSECTRFADDFDNTGKLLRAVAVTATPSLVMMTQRRVRDRALYLQEQRSRTILIAISFCIGVMTSALSSWLWWRFGAWAASRLGLPSAIVQPGIFIASTLPAVVIAVVMLASSRPVIDRSLTMAVLGEHQEGERQ
jgi:hypothetical protein